MMVFVFCASFVSWRRHRQVAVQKLCAKITLAAKRRQTCFVLLFCDLAEAIYGQSCNLIQSFKKKKNDNPRPALARHVCASWRGASEPDTGARGYVHLRVAMGLGIPDTTGMPLRSCSPRPGSKDPPANAGLLVRCQRSHRRHHHKKSRAEPAPPYQPHVTRTTTEDDVFPEICYSVCALNSNHHPYCMLAP